MFGRSEITNLNNLNSLDSKPTTILTYSGGWIDPLNPKPEDIGIEDIAHGLAMTCRFSGQCSEFYSVAEHSIICANYLYNKHLDKRLALWGLLHDASEALLTDVPGPIKPHLSNFKEIEDRVLKMIITKYGLDWPAPPEVKLVDRELLKVEFKFLFFFSHTLGSVATSDTDIDPDLQNTIEPLSHKLAELKFLNMFRELTY